MNYSRSILFGYAIPFTHTGVRATYKVNDMLTVLGGVNQGWDAFEDPNHDKTLELEPNGVFLSNGPGDPAAVEYAPGIVRQIASKGVPIFGICLGHQILGLTYGAGTVKMPYGHRGGNHPVRDIASGRVLITSQNHGFAVEGSERGIKGAKELEVTHVNLNDGSVEGLRHRELPIFAVQYHPEAAPGPHDGRPLFNQFLDVVRKQSA